MLNLSQYGGDFRGNFAPDDQMPGIPGTTLSDDGINAEIITFVQLPAGWLRLGVYSDDGFRAQAGYINKPEDGVILGQFDGGRGASDTIFEVLVQEAGIYPIRIIYQDGGGDGNIEFFSVMADGTKVLINDPDNGGYRAYRAGTAPNKPTAPPQFTRIQKNANGSVTIEWTGGGTLQSAPAVTGAWQNVTASSPYTVTPTRNTYWRLRQ
ncbi:MAG: hypothetical protein IPM17_02615 [Verrucomicrobia bacterium]|nr:hypothetical protein [Verrucomicrobiota bacterium]